MILHSVHGVPHNTSGTLREHLCRDRNRSLRCRFACPERSANPLHDKVLLAARPLDSPTRPTSRCLNCRRSSICRVHSGRAPLMQSESGSSMPGFRLPAMIPSINLGRRGCPQHPRHVGRAYTMKLAATWIEPARSILRRQLQSRSARLHRRPPGSSPTRSLQPPPAPEMPAARRASYRIGSRPRAVPAP